MEQERSIKIGWVQWGVRLSVAGLFGMALAGKLVDPSRFLTPLQGGLGLSGSGFRARAFGFGLSGSGAGAFFVMTVLTLGVLIALLLFRRSGLGSERAWVGAFGGVLCCRCGVFDRARPE